MFIYPFKSNIYWHLLTYRMYSPVTIFGTWDYIVSINGPNYAWYYIMWFKDQSEEKY